MAPNREAGPTGPGPGAPRRLQTFPNSGPTCHGRSKGQLSGAPGRLPRPPAPRSRLSRQADRHTPRPGPGPFSARPLGDPAALGEHLPPRRPGAAARRRPGSQPPPALEETPGTVNTPGPGALPRPGAELLTCRRCRSTLLSGGAPTRPGRRPLRSPPGQARGGAGASPERRNPPPGQPPAAPGSTRGRAGEDGHGGRRSPSSRTEPGG